MRLPSQRCTIFVAGEVNAGKSSFLNALSGGVVSNVSLQRETFNPIWYQYSHSGTEENLKRVSMGLEAVCKQNESLRQSIGSLKEEEVSSFLKVNDDLNELPVRYGLAPFNLVDCPGINDAEDTEKQLFFTALQNRISAADLIIFVTDATTAFSKASEIAEFKKIQQLVEAENATGHYIELIIVVNKFDSLEDNDLCQIFNRIFEKLPSFSREKVFRFSSHKMLIDNVLRSKLHLYLPTFNKSELQRILNNCNVQLTSRALASIKKNRILHYTDIVIQKEISNVLPDEDDSKGGPSVEAKADDVGSLLQVEPYFEAIEFLRRFQTELHERRVAFSVRFLQQTWEKLLDSLVNPTRANTLQADKVRLEAALQAKVSVLSSVQAHVYYQNSYEHALSQQNQRFAAQQLHLQQLQQLRSEMQLVTTELAAIVSKPETQRRMLTTLTNLIQRFDDMAARNCYEEQILPYLSQLCKASGSTVACKTLLVLFWRKNLLTKDLVAHIQGRCADFNIEVHETFAQLFIANPQEPPFDVEWDKSCSQWLKHFGSAESTFACKPLEQFPDVETPASKDVSVIPGKPLLSMLVSKTEVPKQVRLLLRLATLPLTHINELDRSNNLPYDLLEEFSPGMIRSLRLLMTTPSLTAPTGPEQPLNHKFFRLEAWFPQLTSYRSFLQEWKALC